MPFIDVRLNCSLTAEKEEELKAGFGRLIEEIPEKTEGSLMMQFSDNCRLWHGGEKGFPIALVNVMLLGSSTRAAYQSFSNGCIALLEKELGVAGNHVYVKFEEVPNWFWG